MNYQEQSEAVDRLFALIGARWFVLVALTILVFGLTSSGTVVSNGETLQRIAIIFVAALVATLLEWGIVHGEGMRSSGGLLFSQIVHIALLVVFIFLLLWFAGIREEWASLLFVIPVFEAAFIVGPVGVFVAGLFAVLAAWSTAAMVAGGVVVSKSGMTLAPLFFQETLDIFFPQGFVFVAAILIAAVGSYAWSREKQRLRRARKSAHSLLLGLEEGVVVYNDRFVVRYVNSAAERLLGVHRRDIIGHQAGRFATIAAPGAENLSKILFADIGDQRSDPIELKDPDRTVVVTQRSLFGPDGEPLGMVRLIRDVTHQQRVGKLKSEFISVAAHQLRTPLSGVRWAMEELKEDPELTGGQRTAVLQASEAVNRTIMLVNELLNVARIEEGRFDYEFSPEQIEELIADVVRELTAKAKEKGVVLEYKSPSDPLPPLRMDREKFRMVIETLVDNAINYTPADGHIFVEATLKDGEALFMVEDTGVGIPGEQQDQIFTKFFRGDNVVRLQTEGSGLGLFIARNIVERHNGRIWFESEKGTGTRFFVTLPLSSDTPKDKG